jgi:glycosyltransferase involved in cell wall biosynthesis
MSGRSTVAVVIPAFRAASFLPAAVESVLQQTRDDWELLVVDDGSDDDSAAACRPYTEDRRIRYVWQENAGVSVARNRGAALSGAPYLAWLDADDVWHPDKLAACLVKLRSQPDLGLVHTDMQAVTVDSRHLHVLSGKEGWILDDVLLWNGCTVPGPSGMVVPRRVFEEIGGFDPQLSTAADQDFYIRVAARYRVGRVPEVLGSYRIHPAGMHTRIDLMEADHIRVYDKAARAGLFRSAWFRRRCYSNLFLILAGSWWKDGRRPGRGLFFLARALLMYPPNAWTFAWRHLRKRLSRTQT